MLIPELKLLNQTSQFTLRTLEFKQWCRLFRAWDYHHYFIKHFTAAPELYFYMLLKYL